MIIFLFATFLVILNYLDILLIKRAGKCGAYEATPLTKFLKKTRLLIPFKVAMLVLVLFFMIATDEETGVVIGFLSCLFYIGIVLNNFRTYRSLMEKIIDTL